MAKKDDIVEFAFRPPRWLLPILEFEAGRRGVSVETFVVATLAGRMAEAKVYEDATKATKRKRRR